jgi:hypothetical protein
MPDNCCPAPDDRDQELRIADLKRQAQHAAGGPVVSWESDLLSGDQREEFWRRVMECEENQAMATDFERLIEAGLELPEPQALDDAQLSSKLWEVMRALIRMRVLVESTDHLSDRELYALMWNELLRVETPSEPADTESTWHVDVLGRCSEADTTLYLKYYADEDWRRQWLAEFPDYEMPAHENPPYDRDRLIRDLADQ